MIKRGDEVFIPCTVLCMGTEDDENNVVLMTDTDNRTIKADICQVYSLEDLNDVMREWNKRKVED